MAHGGARPSAGRPKGAKSKFNQALGVAKDAIGEGKTPLEYMLEVMRSEDVEVGVRLEAAKGAAPYVHKKQPMDVNHTGNAIPVSITMNVVGPRRQ